VYIRSKCSWRWVKLSPETCIASLKESVKQILVHLVDCWYNCTSDAHSHKRQILVSNFDKIKPISEHVTLLTYTETMYQQISLNIWWSSGSRKISSFTFSLFYKVYFLNYHLALHYETHCYHMQNTHGC